MDNQPKPLHFFGKTFVYHDTFTGPQDADLLKTIENYNKAGHKTHTRTNKQDKAQVDLFVRQDNTRNQ